MCSSLVIPTILSPSFFFFAHPYYPVALVLLTIVFLRRLMRNGLGILLILATGILVADIVKFSFGIKWLTPVVYIELCALVLSLANYKALKASRLLPLVLLNLFFATVESVATYLAAKSIFNLFLYNFYYLMRAPICFFFFYHWLEPKGKQKAVFFTAAIFSMIVFVVDYVTNNEVKLNYVSIIFFGMEMIIISSLVLFKIVSDIKNEIELLKDPMFWICGGLVLRHSAEMILEGLHPYLVANHIDIYRNAFMRAELAIRELPFGYMYFYAVCLAIINYRRINDAPNTASGLWLNRARILKGATKETIN